VQRRRDLADDLETDERRLGLQTESATGNRVCHVAVVCDACTGDDLVVEIDDETGVISRDSGNEGREVPGVHMTGIHRHPAGQIVGSHHHNAFVNNCLARLGDFTVPARRGCHVDDHRAATHSLDHLPGDEKRGMSPRYLGRCDHNVGVGNALGEGILLASLGLISHLPGVSAGRRNRLVDGCGNEAGTEALYLLSYFGSDVVCRDNGPEPFGRGDRLETGDTGTENEQLHGWNGACRRGEHREESRRGRGGQEHSVVTGCGGL